MSRDAWRLVAALVGCAVLGVLLVVTDVLLLMVLGCALLFGAGAVMLAIFRERRLQAAVERERSSSDAR